MVSSLPCATLSPRFGPMMRTVKAGMEPDLNQGEGGILIAPGRAAEFDLEMVDNPVLAAILTRVRSGEANSGRSFNNFVN